MAKDPAFLFYVGDWLGGTLTFSRHQKGAYMDLLMAQFNHGHMDLHTIQDILGSDFDLHWERKLKAKFKIDADGKYYNERLDIEQSKRKNYSQSRRNNLLHMDTHIDNENENKDESVIKDINVRKIEFIEKSTEIISTDDTESLNKFFDYWTEANENGKKMRFEFQKVFDVKRRFSTWQSNNKKWNGKQSGNIGDRKESVGNLKNLARKILENDPSKNSN